MRRENDVVQTAENGKIALQLLDAVLYHIMVTSLKTALNYG